MLAQWDWTGIIGGLVSFLVVLFVQQSQRIYRSRGTTISTIAFAALVAYVWAPFGFPNSDWSRAPLGSDVIRLIPFVNFDPALLQTQWLLVQVSMGASTFLLATLALYGDARRAAFAVIGIMAVGLEISQGFSNYFSSPVPPYRIDVHDIMARAAGALAIFFVLKVAAAIWRLRVNPGLRKGGLFGFFDGVTRRI
jgi:glycopeptide antibiotics resistance protein